MSMLAVEREELVEQFGEDVCAKLDQAVADGSLTYQHIALDTSEHEVMKNIAPTVGEIYVPEWVTEIQALLNTPIEMFLDHIRINAARPDVPWLNVVPFHEGHAAIVGGGSSLQIPSQIDEIAERRRLGQTIIALNGVGKYLTDRHLKPDYLVICDGRAENVRFLEGLPAKKFLLASQCHPSLFDYLIERGADVMLFHPALDRLNEVLPKGTNVCMIGGHHTVGLMAMSVMTALGYRMLHLYGYDSCDGDDGAPHAYPQAQTSAEAKRLEIVCAGRKFRCSFAMYKQAEAFGAFTAMLAEFGCTITVHGDGLIPTIAREMTTAWPPNAACYDMSKAPASFDFVTWLVVAEMDRCRRGVTEPLIVAFVAGPEDGFRPGDVQNAVEKQAILDNVMRPALALFGATESKEAVTGRQFHYWYRPITDGFNVGEEVPRCKPPAALVMKVAHELAEGGIKPRDALVITLRETRYTPERNSDLDAWTEFARRRRAEGIPVIFVRDTAMATQPIEDFPIHSTAASDLQTRAALYSLARCNLIVANGPAELLQFSDWPFIEMKPPSVDLMRPVSMGDTWWQRFAGITPPETFPWLGPHQLTVWKKDTLDNLETAWAEWLDLNGKER